MKAIYTKLIGYMPTAMPLSNPFKINLFKKWLSQLKIPTENHLRFKLVVGVSALFILIGVITLYFLLRTPPKFLPITAEVANKKTNLPHPQEVIAVLSRMASERDLRGLKFEAHNDLVGAEVRINATLDTQAQAILKRMLGQFYTQYQTAIPIATTVALNTDQLPFTIGQVITGPMASIVTTQGERVFVGDRIQGYQLMRIEPGKLVFVGDQRIELPW